jgi:hypothetical protein
MRLAGLFCLCAAALPAHAQSVPRIKASVVAFDGAVITVRPEGERDTMKIAIRPATRILKEEAASLAAIPEGGFIGATLAKSAIGAFSAQEVHVFPEGLRGSGEGLYPATPGSSFYVLNGSVTAATPTTISVKFRGASGAGANCAGRAPPDTSQGCQGNATFAVAAGTPVIALSLADKSLIKPGAVLALSVMAGPDGRPVTPGLTIQTIATPEVPLPPAPRQFPQPPRKPS